MSRNNRDLGIRGGAGKGDSDRTDDVKKFQENLAEIPLNPSDKTGFKRIGAGRFRKTYQKPVNSDSGESAPPAASVPTPLSLLAASRARRARLAGGSADH